MSALFHHLLIPTLLSNALLPKGVRSLLRGLFLNAPLLVLYKRTIRFFKKEPYDVHFKLWLPAAGTDEDAVLMLLTSRCNDQRQQIKAAYKKAYGKVRRTEGSERAADRRQLN